MTRTLLALLFLFNLAIGVYCQSLGAPRSPNQRLRPPGFHRGDIYVVCATDSNCAVATAGIIRVDPFGGGVSKFSTLTPGYIRHDPYRDRLLAQAVVPGGGANPKFLQLSASGSYTELPNVTGAGAADAVPVGDGRVYIPGFGGLWILDQNDSLSPVLDAQTGAQFGILWGSNRRLVYHEASNSLVFMTLAPCPPHHEVAVLYQFLLDSLGLSVTETRGPWEIGPCPTSQLQLDVGLDGDLGAVVGGYGAPLDIRRITVPGFQSIPVAEWSSPGCPILFHAANYSSTLNGFVLGQSKLDTSVFPPRYNFSMTLVAEGTFGSGCTLPGQALTAARCDVGPFVAIEVIQ